MKNLLLTGCAGFIGSHMAEKILTDERFRDYQVIALDNFDAFYDLAIKKKNLEKLLPQSRFKFIEGFSGDTPLLHKIFSEFKISGVIHLAARAGVGPSLKDPGMYAYLNLMGTQELLHLAGKGLGGAGPVEQFIFASSSSVYGKSSEVPFSEKETCLEPLSPYAATKRAGEVLAWNAFHLYGLPLTSLRFFTVYGPRQRPEMAISKFTRAIRDGHPVELFDGGSLRRDFTYVDDIVSGALNSYFYRLGEPHYEIFNLGNSQTVSVKELISQLEIVVGKKAIVKNVPSPAGEMPITFANIDKAKQLLKYEPRTNLSQGLQKYWNSL